MKNINYTILLFFLVALLSCESQKKTTTNKKDNDNTTTAKVKQSKSHHASNKKHDYQKKFIPKPFRYLYLGMPIEEFKKVNPNAIIHDGNLLNYRITAEQQDPDPAIKEILFYFDTEDHNPLYELIIEFKDKEEHDKVVKELYGEPNFHNNRWKIDVHEGFDLMVWEHETKLVIVGKLDHSEFTHKD